MGSYVQVAMEQAAYRAWAAGKVVPDRITTALDETAANLPKPPRPPTSPLPPTGRRRLRRVA